MTVQQPSSNLHYEEHLASVKALYVNTTKVLEHILYDCQGRLGESLREVCQFDSIGDQQCFWS